MHVYIDIFIRNGYKQNDNSEGSRWQNTPIRIADSVKDDLVANQRAVDEEKHRIAVVLLNVRPGCKQMNLDAAPAQVLLILQQLLEKVLSKDLKYPFTKPAGRGC